MATSDRHVELIAACIGAAIAHTERSTSSRFTPAENWRRACWDIFDRMALELSLDDRTFDRDRFLAETQSAYLAHGGAEVSTVGL